MKKKILVTLIAAISVSSLLVGCGNSHKYADSTANYFAPAYSGTSASSDYYYSDDYYEADYDSYYDSGYSDFYNVAEANVATDFGSSSVEAAANSSGTGAQIDESRKLITTVSLDVETLEFDKLIDSISSQVNVYGGYIEDSYTYNGSKYDYYQYGKSGSMTLRIPADKLDAFLESFTPLCNILNKSMGVEDVTLTYVDLESHKSALLIEQDRLLVLLESAENLEDMLTIESRLTDIRYQLESMESQLRTYDNKINYSTVYININEVKEITPEPEPEPETAWERICKGFTDSVKNIGNGFKEFGIWFVVNFPYLLLWAVIIFANVMIIRGIIRFNIKKSRKRRAEREAINKEKCEAVSLAEKEAEKETEKKAEKIAEQESEQNAEHEVEYQVELKSGTEAVVNENKNKGVDEASEGNNQ